MIIAEDQALLRGTLRMLIDPVPGLAVAGEAATGAEAVGLARRELPGLVLMDIQMPEVDGIIASYETGLVVPARRRADHAHVPAATATFRPLCVIPGAQFTGGW